MKSWSVHSVLSSNQYVIKGFHVFQHYDEKKKSICKSFQTDESSVLAVFTFFALLKVCSLRSVNAKLLLVFPLVQLWFRFGRQCLFYKPTHQ